MDKKDYKVSFKFCNYDGTSFLDEKLEQILIKLFDNEIEGFELHLLKYKIGLDLLFYNRYDEALELFTQSEKEGPNGKYSQSTLEKAKIHQELGNLEEALKLTIKAEHDSENFKFPEASLIKGNILFELKIFDESIEAYNKSIFDSFEERNPDAAFGKAKALAVLGQIDDSINYLWKAIRESEDEIFSDAFLLLSLIHRAQRKLNLAENFIFIALHQNPRNREIVSTIIEWYSNFESIKFYENRLKYFDTLLLKSFEGSHKSLISISSICDSKELVDIDDLQLFISLLKIKKIEFPRKISYQERIKSAYLLHFMLEEYWYVFYLIDDVLDSSFDLNSTDYYFYFISALKIGEPVNELKYFLDYIPEENNLIADLYNKLKIEIKHKIATNDFLDPYLLKWDITKKYITKELLSELHLNEWLNELIISFIDTSAYHPVPLKRNEMIGMLTQLIDSVHTADLEKHENTELRNFISLIEQYNIYEKTYYIDNVYNIRQAIKSGIDSHSLIKKLAQLYIKETDPLVKRNIAILQSAVLISYQLDYLNSEVTKVNYMHLSSASAANVLTESFLRQIIELGLAGSFGISVAISFISKKIFNVISTNSTLTTDEIFHELIDEIST